MRTPTLHQHTQTQTHSHMDAGTFSHKHASAPELTNKHINRHIIHNLFLYLTQSELSFSHSNIENMTSLSHTLSYKRTNEPNYLKVTHIYLISSFPFSPSPFCRIKWRTLTHSHPPTRTHTHTHTHSHTDAHTRTVSLLTTTIFFLRRSSDFKSDLIEYNGATPLLFLWQIPWKDSSAARSDSQSSCSRCFWVMLWVFWSCWSALLSFWVLVSIVWVNQVILTQIPFEHWSLAILGLDRTWIGDWMGTPLAAGMGIENWYSVGARG